MSTLSLQASRRAKDNTIMIHAGAAMQLHSEARPVFAKQGCGIKGFFPTSVIQVGISPFIWGVSLWG